MNANTHWKNKVILITGAGSGIGLALTELFSQLEAKLILVDIHKENLSAVTTQFNSNVILSEVVDVSSLEQWQSLADQIKKEVGQLDVLINNAGICSFGYFSELSVALFEKVMQVNFNGVMYGCHTMMPLLEKSESSLIVNMSSIMGVIAAPGLSPYHASKFAVRGFSEALRQEMILQNKNLDVLCVTPGGVNTRIAKNTYSEGSINKDYVEHFKKYAVTSAPEAAAMIEEGMRKKRHRIFVGFDSKVAQWINRLMPEDYFKLTNRFIGMEQFLNQ